MKQLDVYVDLCGNQYVLADLEPAERRLVMRFCRRGWLTSKWRPFARGGYQALGRLAVRRGIPVADMFQCVAAKILEDLISRLRIQKGKGPCTRFRSYFEEVLHSGEDEAHQLADIISMPARVLSDIFAGGADTPLDDLRLFLDRLENLHLLLSDIRGVPARCADNRIMAAFLWRPKTQQFEPAFRLYKLHFVGGPNDGRITYFPCAHLGFDYDNEVYQLVMDGDQPVMEWVDEETRAIRVHFKAERTKAGEP